MHRRTFNTTALAALVMGLGATASRADDKSVVIGQFGDPTPTQLVAASDELSKATGYKIEWRKFASGAEVIAAMASGDIKLSQLGSSPFAIAASQGVDLQLFMISEGIGSAEALIARNGTGIEKVEDLKGKKVATPLGSTAHFSLMGALENAGVAAADVTVLGMKPDEIAAAWSQDQIDAAFIWQPVQSKLLANGKMIIDAGQVTGKPTFNGWVVNREWAEQNKDFLVAFVKAEGKAFDDYNSHSAAWTPDSAEVKTIAERTGAAPADIPDILKGYSFPALKDQASEAWLGGAMTKNAAATAAFLVAQKRIPAALDDYSKFITTDYLNAAMK